MENNKNIDKYTKKILQEINLPEVSNNFTDNIMNKIVAEKQSSVETVPIKIKYFTILFSLVFLPLIFIAVFTSGENYALPEYLSFIESIKILDFDLNIFSKTFSENTFIQILPISIGILIIIDHLFLKRKKYNLNI